MAHELITSYTFSGTQNSLDITSIPTTYKDLQLIFKLKSVTSGYNLYPHIRFNSNSGSSNYFQMEMRASNGTDYYYQNLDSQLYLYGGETDSGKFTSGHLELGDYNRDSGHSGLIAMTNSFWTSQSFFNIAEAVGDITSIQVIADLSSTKYFSSDSKVWLYGIGEA